MLTKEKLQELTLKMTLEEKINMIHGDGLFQTKGIKRLGIPPLIMSDGPMGVRKEFFQKSWQTTDFSDDFVSYFLSNTALASTWNPDLAHEFGKALGAESRSRGKDVILAPGINIIRSPLCGRNFEYMSEDPYLIKKMAVPIIQGIQENDVAACVKHFIANNQETNRMFVDVDVDERALEEIYFPGFEAATTEGNAYSIMAAYNKFQGTYCCENTYLLQDVLRGRWKYDGVVISDWSACHSTAKSALAGLDIEMSVSTDFDDYYFANPYYDLAKREAEFVSLLDEKILHILNLMNKLHMLDGKRKIGSRNSIEHQENIRKAGEESIILLKNMDSFLPLNSEQYSSILVVGENAITKHSSGGGSAEIQALYEHTPYAGISMHLGGGTKLTYAAGYSSDKDVDVHKAFDLMEHAVRLASAHELVIFVGGLNHSFDSEGIDRSEYHLPYNQDLLIKRLASVNPNIVSIMICGSAADLQTVSSSSKALLLSSYNGMEGGKAITNILFGITNPSGKLPYTIAKTLEDYSSHSIGEFPGGETVRYNESIFVGYRHFDSNHVEPMYPFGYGLSYSIFNYHNLKVKQDNSNRIIEVSLQVTNQSERFGKEVIQLYVHHKDSSIPKAKKELKSFQKIGIDAHATEELVLRLSYEDLSYFDEHKKMKCFDKGTYTIMIGSSSRDIRLQSDFTL